MGFTVAVPDMAQEEQTALSMESAVADPPVICQDNVAIWPAVMVAGDTLRLRVKGTVTVVVLVAVVPSDEVAVRVKVVVAVMGTMSEPEVAKVVPSGTGTAGDMAIEAAWVVAQVTVDVWPPFTSVGLAENCVIWGTMGGGPGGVDLPFVLHPGSCKNKMSSPTPNTVLRI